MTQIWSRNSLELFLGLFGPIWVWAHSANPFTGPILATLRGRYLAIWAVFDPETKKAPNDPKLVQKQFGVVFRTFSDILGRFGFWVIVQIPFTGPILATLRGRYLEIWAVFDPETKNAPNDPKLVWDEFGNVFRTFSARVF